MGTARPRAVQDEGQTVDVPGEGGQCLAKPDLRPIWGSPPCAQPPTPVQGGVVDLCSPRSVRADPSLFAVKAGYCYKVAPVGGVFDGKNCSACLENNTCSTCCTDGDCPRGDKCCPDECGYSCQMAVTGTGVLAPAPH